ncbi:MAG: cyclic lactone autoinducer peptide [Ignavibacteriales bacterium]
MTGIKLAVKETYIKMLSLLGMTATLFALMSASSTSIFWFGYEPKMPTKLIKQD